MRQARRMIEDGRKARRVKAETAAPHGSKDSKHDNKHKPSPLLRCFLFIVVLIPFLLLHHTLTDTTVLHENTVITQSCVIYRHGGRARCEEAELRQKGVRHISAKGLDMSGDGTDVEQHIVIQGMESWKHEKWKALHVFWEQRAAQKIDLKKSIRSKRASLKKSQSFF